MNEVQKIRAEREFLEQHRGEPFDESWLDIVETQQEKEALRGIYALEAMMKKGNATGSLQPTVCPVQHFFAPGVYVRKMLIPAGVATIGHVHKYPCVTMISGDVIITTAGGGTVRYGPDATFESPANAKRAVWALKDTFLTTIHGNPDNERDPEKIFSMLIVDVYEKLTGERTKELGYD
jgi:hypothetical protein